MMMANKKWWIRTIVLATLAVISSNLFGQSQDQDFLRSTGKIYSVVLAVVIIFIAIAVYLWRIDRKLTKLENNLKDEHKTS